MSLSADCLVWAVALAFHKPVEQQGANQHLSLFLYTLLLSQLRSAVSSQSHFTFYFLRHVYSGTYSSLELSDNTKNSDIYFTEGD